MKRETVNYFAVGLFVLLALGVLLVALYFIIGGTGVRDTYYTHYRNVAGIAPGTLVTYEGYQVGQVAKIEPQRSDAGVVYEVELQLHKGWQVPTDSIARVRTDGLLAETVVNISEGQARTFLAPGGLLAGEQGVDLFASIGSLAGDFGELSEQAIRPLLDNLNHSVQRIGGELETRLPLILDEMQQLLVRLDTSAQSLSSVLNADSAAQAHRVLDNIDQGAAEFRELTEGLGQVKRDAAKVIARLDGLLVQTRPDLQQAVSDLRLVLMQVSRYSDSILQNLDSGSRNMSEFSRQIRENPARLIGGAAPSDEEARR